MREWCNGVIPFMWDRLPLKEGARDTSPSLAEDWFVEDAIAAGSPFVWRTLDPEASHRALYRYATMDAWKRGEYGGSPERLLLHQIVILIPVLFAVAAEVFQEQRATDDRAA